MKQKLIALSLILFLSLNCFSQTITRVERRRLIITETAYVAVAVVLCWNPIAILVTSPIVLASSNGVCKLIKHRVKIKK